ncbi:Aminotransferase, DegT/DnrJ/EryC1/StrS family [hydrothermal vent metagenome]|uniref:Aminotransferase, DegT/DnrJ/EryC1/StrS family n=1 Tax=hydrothermal vent metagenome TaxID=652676 RepID=A0A3B1AHN5_9ZZZZ
MIPMVDLKTQYKTLKSEIDQNILTALENAQFVLGPNVKEFEREAAKYLSVKHAISCASGTDALHLALIAAGIGEGDEVITTSFTFIATAEAICYVGATPVFVDVLPDSFNIDPKCIKAAITSKTKAILPVHIFGQPANMDAIMAIAKSNSLKVIEDCAQSFGAAIKGNMTGGIGLAGCHSFFPSKNLGCYGDGGMITTNDDAIAEKLLSLRNHGSSVRYHHDIIGYNSRLDELQAVILRAKLNNIKSYNDNRRRVGLLYSELLKEFVQPPIEDGIGTHVYHQYTVLTDKRDQIMAALSKNDIACAIYYPIPLHKQNVFKDQCANINLPVTDKIVAQCMSLPVFPELSDEQVKSIVAVIGQCF